MGKFGRCQIQELKEFQEKLNRLQDSDEFLKSCAKELAARLLSKVVKRTIVGDYSVEIEVTAKRDSKHHKKGDVYKKRVNKSGKTGGTLRRGWTGGKNISVQEYVDSLKIHHSDDAYVIEIINETEYASYVEYGHRTRDHKRWIPGEFMMTISEQELKTIAPKVLEAKLEKHLRECMR